MSEPAPARARALTALGVLALTLLLRAAGWLQPFEDTAADTRARILQREVSTDIVIVGIDARSLADLQQWSRRGRYHARVWQPLADADPRLDFIDIDFSVPREPDDDAALEAALTRFRATDVILPIFVHPATGADT